MRFLLLVIDNASGTASADEMAAIDEFNDRLVADGHWITAGGLRSPHHSVLVDNRGGAGIAEERSLVESHDYYSGFWLIDAQDEQTALGLAIDGSKACNRRVELRPLL